MANDAVQRFLFDDTDIRGEITTLDAAFQDATAHQDIQPSLLPVFGQFLAGATLLSEVLKFEGILTLQAQGDGDLNIVMAEANHKGEVRGIVRTREGCVVGDELPPLSELLGKSTLTITIDPVKGKRYQGIVPIEGNTLAECLEKYFAQSEQLPTHIQLFANTEQCGGLFLQCLPAQLVTDEKEREEFWLASTHLAATVSEDELYDLASEELLTRLFHEMRCRVFSAKPLSFKCSCSRSRSAKALESLGHEDAMALVKKQETIKIDCQFCGKTYSFTEKDIQALFQRPDGNTLH